MTSWKYNIQMISGVLPCKENDCLLMKMFAIIVWPLDAPKSRLCFCDFLIYVSLLFFCGSDKSLLSNLKPTDLRTLYRAGLRFPTPRG